MPKAIRQLIARGYWDVADGGDGTGGSGGGGGEGGKPNADDKSDDGKGGGDNDGEGKPKPSDKEAQLLKEVMDKKGKITSLTTQLEQVNASLKAWEGLDPAAVRALIAEADARKTKELEDKGAWDALKKQLIDAHTAEVGTKDANLAKALESQKALADQIATLTVGVSFGQSKFLAEEVNYSVNKMRKLYGPHFEFDGTKVVAYDKPAGESGRAVLIDGKGEPLDFDAAIRKLVDNDEDRDSILKSKAKPGAASRTDPKAKPPKETVELTGRDRIAAGLRSKKT